MFLLPFQTGFIHTCSGDYQIEPHHSSKQRDSYVLHQMTTDHPSSCQHTEIVPINLMWDIPFPLLKSEIQIDLACEYVKGNGALFFLLADTHLADSPEIMALQLTHYPRKYCGCQTIEVSSF
ncbi:hypothetical protein CDAR_242951 [Caerostris darwini]|uniref:Uncharacterized protein n=1 Tax=Caerostris darwini TaxID=1538125 RepID=A0AAV4SSJ4_9ARAC|nr:hypothetical protein CDAR_242951 [Caerostris darwini]